MHLQEATSEALRALRRQLAAVRETTCPFTHAADIRSQREALIFARVRMVAKLFAILTPLWIVVDSVAFERHVWLDLAILRLLAAAAFVALATWRKVENHGWLTAALPLVLLMAVPPMFYVAAGSVLAGAQFDTLGLMIAGTYTLVPVLVIAGLALFPLTLLEVMVVSVPVVALTIMTPPAHVAGWAERTEVLWLMVLLVGVAAIACGSQLNHMILLVARSAQDPLTGARTRRSGQEALERQFAEARESHRAFAVAFIDIDNFKAINDAYGHDVGDQILKQAAEKLAANLRPTDQLVRWGGEEFLLLLPGVDQKDLERIIARIQNQGLGKRPDGTPLTASIGAADLASDPTISWEAMVELADSRMYSAKRSGKNRYVLSSAA